MKFYQNIYIYNQYFMEILFIFASTMALIYDIVETLMILIKHMLGFLVPYSLCNLYKDLLDNHLTFKS
jgi:hypothetical protein